jgi:hypothetical protein
LQTVSSWSLAQIYLLPTQAGTRLAHNFQFPEVSHLVLAFEHDSWDYLLITANRLIWKLGARKKIKDGCA